jgi:hypothetical protein
MTTESMLQPQNRTLAWMLAAGLVARGIGSVVYQRRSEQDDEPAPDR